MQRAFRIILSAVLVYFIYQETGWATATSIGLIFIGQEVANYTIQNLLQIVKLYRRIS